MYVNKKYFYDEKNKIGVVNNLIFVKIIVYDFKIWGLCRVMSVLIGFGFFIVLNIWWMIIDLV